MLYRVAVELRDLERTVYFEAANASEVEALTARIGYGEIWDRIELVAIRGQIQCPEHGWSLIDAGGCAECLDEYYRPELEDDDSPYDWHENREDCFCEECEQRRDRMWNEHPRVDQLATTLNDDEPPF